MYYSGRILPIQGVGGCPGLPEAALDLYGATICVPLSDSHSPIVDEVHWYHPDVNHSGVESELRQIEQISHIIGGRQIVKSVKSVKWECY